MPFDSQYAGAIQGLEGLNWTDFLQTSHPVPVLNDAHAALLVKPGKARRQVIVKPFVDARHWSRRVPSSPMVTCSEPHREGLGILDISP